MRLLNLHFKLQQQFEKPQESRCLEQLTLPLKKIWNTFRFLRYPSLYSPIFWSGLVIRSYRKCWLTGKNVSKTKTWNMYWKTGAANISWVESHQSGNNGVYCLVCGCSYDRVLKVTSKKGHSCPTQMLDGFSPKLNLKIHQFRDHLIVQILKSHSVVSTALLHRQEYRIHWQEETKWK